jgi:hypothetical protein
MEGSCFELGPRSIGAVLAFCTATSNASLLSGLLLSRLEPSLDPRRQHDVVSLLETDLIQKCF